MTKERSSAAEIYDKKPESKTVNNPLEHYANLGMVVHACDNGIKEAADRINNLTQEVMRFTDMAKMSLSPKEQDFLIRETYEEKKKKIDVLAHKKGVLEQVRAGAIDEMETMGNENPTIEKPGQKRITGLEAQGLTTPEAKNLLEQFIAEKHFANIPDEDVMDTIETFGEMTDQEKEREEFERETARKIEDTELEKLKIASRKASDSIPPSYDLPKKEPDIDMELFDKAI